MSIQRVAIVGAGMSGLTAGSSLREAGFDVQIFEKSRGCGGRMATRRSSGLEFDHGAQYFTVRHPAFQEAVSDWVGDGVASLWGGPQTPSTQSTPVSARDFKSGFIIPPA